MRFDIDLDDPDLRAIIAAHVLTRHALVCQPEDIRFEFTPGDDRDQLPWLRAHVRAEPG